MLLGWLFAILLAGTVPHVQGQIRTSISLGAVLSESGFTEEMVDARKGYELAVDEVNRLNDGQGLKITHRNNQTHFFTFNFTALDDKSNKEKHDMLLRDLVKDGQGSGVDFLMGSHPAYAESEIQLANRAHTINVQCCVGPDGIYEQDIPEVFGVARSNAKYPELAVRKMMLLGFRNIAIINMEDNVFTGTTCAAAKDMIDSFEKLDKKVVLERVYTKEEGQDGAVFDQFVENCRDRAVEAVVACSFRKDGENLVEAFHKANLSMKAFFMTLGPTQADWVENLGNKADYMLSSAPWHEDLYKEGFTNLELFESVPGYLETFRKKHGKDSHPSYVTVSASASIHVVMKAIHNAFESCDISTTDGDVAKLFYDETTLTCDEGSTLGYERVKTAMKELKLETVYGPVQFNEHRRNDGGDPATLQVLKPEGKRSIKLVLPVEAATSDLEMPSKNAFPDTCTEGYKAGRDDFEPCQACPSGQYSNRINTKHCDSCPVGLYNNKEGQAECASCPDGKTTSTTGSSSIAHCFCKPGFYNQTEDNNSICEPCPQGADCGGHGNPPVPNFGYWMDRAFPSRAYSCDPEDACLGGFECSEERPEIFEDKSSQECLGSSRVSKCSEGRGGRMCASCIKGYFSIANSCAKCFRKIVVVLLILLVVFLWYVLNVVMSKNLASLELILSWAQLANIIGDVDLQWPAGLKNMFSVANFLDFDVDILEPSCLASWSYFHNFVVQLLLPFVMSIMAFMGYLASWIAFRIRNTSILEDQIRLKWWLSWVVTMPDSQEDLNRKWDATIAAFLTSVEVTYITITKYCFDAFKCQNTGTVMVLRSDPSVECGTWQHVALRVLGAIGIVGYSVGYIAFVLWKMCSIRHTSAFTNAENLRRYGFFYKRFELAYFWTPLVCLFRRFLFVVTLVFMNNPAFQAGTLAVILIGSLMLHVYTAPYLDTNLDVLFSFLLVTLMLEAFSGVMFYSSNLPPSDRATLQWIIIFSVIVSMCIALVFLFLELRQKYFHRVISLMHSDYLAGRSSASGVLDRLRLWISSEYRETNKDVGNGVLDKFDSSFLYTALRNRREYIEVWDKLTEKLKSFLSDEAECSYLSRKPIAKFWRRLVDRLPELIDFLAVTSEESRAQWEGYAESLYRDFFLTNRIQRLPIFRMVNPRGRAAIAHWLASASQSDRDFFTSAMSNLLKEVDPDLAAVLDEKIENDGVSLSLEKKELGSTSWFRSLSSDEWLVMAEFSRRRSPLEPNRPSFRRTITPRHKHLRNKLMKFLALKLAKNADVPKSVAQSDATVIDIPQSQTSHAGAESASSSVTTVPALSGE